MEHKTLPSPYYKIKKINTFLEVEGKMGPIPQTTSSQYRPPQVDTNPYIRKDNTAEKEKEQHPLKGLGQAQPLSLVKKLHAHL